MSLSPTEILQTVTAPAKLRAIPKEIRPKSFAAGSGTLAILTLVCQAASTGFWQLWTALVSEIDTLTKSGTYTGGTYTLTVDGATTAAIAWNANNVAILAALNALPNIAPGDVVVSGGGAAGISTGAVTLTFGGKKAGRAMTNSVDATNITGGGSITYAVSTAGVEAPTGTENPTGFIWPDPLVLASGGQTISNVMVAGIVNRNDVPLNGVTQGAVDAALASLEFRKLDFTVEGLVGVA